MYNIQPTLLKAFLILLIFDWERNTTKSTQRIWLKKNVGEQTSVLTMSLAAGTAGVPVPLVSVFSVM